MKFKSLNIQESLELIDNGALIIDVREKEEFSNFSLKGSISIPLSILKEISNIEFIRKESKIKQVFTICQLGKRSEKASIMLSKFKIESKSINGGIEQINKIK